jgi:hypothetical protein
MLAGIAAASCIDCADFAKTLPGDQGRGLPSGLRGSCFVKRAKGLTGAKKRPFFGSFCCRPKIRPESLNDIPKTVS